MSGSTDIESGCKDSILIGAVALTDSSNQMKQHLKRSNHDQWLANYRADTYCLLQQFPEMIEDATAIEFRNSIERDLETLKLESLAYLD